MRRDPTPLETMLDAVHAALLGGDFAALPALTQAVEQAAAAGLPGDAATLGVLRRKILRNEACLQASARGLRAARRRLGEIRAARAGLATYTRTGAREQIGRGPGTLAQRF